jgi:hypothetical protein
VIRALDFKFKTLLNTLDSKILRFEGYVNTSYSHFEEPAKVTGASPKTSAETPYGGHCCKAAKPENEPA